MEGTVQIKSAPNEGRKIEVLFPLRGVGSSEPRKGIIDL